MSLPSRRNAQHKDVLDFHRRPLEKPMRRREFITFIGATLTTYRLRRRMNVHGALLCSLGLKTMLKGRPASQRSERECTIWVGAKGATYRWRCALALATPIVRGPTAQN